MFSLGGLGPHPITSILSSLWVEPAETGRPETGPVPSGPNGPRGRAESGCPTLVVVGRLRVVNEEQKTSGKEK